MSRVTPTQMLITGVTGQDGAYLAGQLLAAGSRVTGTLRPTASDAALWRLRELGIASHPQLRLLPLDIEDVEACRRVVSQAQPEQVFHLAGQTRVGDSFRDPAASARLNALGTLNLLDAVRGEAPRAHWVFASTAELFASGVGPFNERSPFRPRSPYAIAKQFAHATTISYRESHGLRASCAILFNHESPLRDEVFVTRKITLGVARILGGKQQDMALGNLSAERDFGYAPEYVQALRTMAARADGDDFVLATGIATPIRDFVTQAFAAAQIDLEWRGSGVDEVGVERNSGIVRVRVDPQFFRPLDAASLVGDSAKARRVLGFEPSIGVAELARLMLETDIQRVRAQCA
jgi:GDPmannose 4,6-dehydratase